MYNQTTKTELHKHRIIETRVQKKESSMNAAKNQEHEAVN